MDSSEINYTNWEHAPTRLGQGPEGWFLVLDQEGDRRPHHEREHRLIGDKDIKRLVAFYETAQASLAQAPRSQVIEPKVGMAETSPPSPRCGPWDEQPDGSSVCRKCGDVDLPFGGGPFGY